MSMNRLYWRFHFTTITVIVFLTVAGTGAVSFSQSLKRIEIAEEWTIKSISPCSTINTALLAEVGQTSKGDGWLAVGEMPAMVHDIVRREQGYKIDRIVLTQGAAPINTGPPESPR